MSKSSGMKKGNITKEWKSWLVLLTMFLGFISCTAFGQDAAAARIAERLTVPVATMPQLKEAPALDAAPDFTGWAGPLALVNLSGTGSNPPVETRGYLAADGTHIYLAVRCEDPAAKEIASAPVPLDGNVWAGDSVEFMLLPGYDSKQTYYHFAVNPADSLYDGKGTDKSWNSSGTGGTPAPTAESQAKPVAAGVSPADLGGAKVFTVVDATGWLAVIRVPLAALGVKDGEAPALWRVNLHRARPARAGEAALDLAWSPTRSQSNHVPKRFGVVSLRNGRAVPAAELDAWLEKADMVEVLYRQTFEQDHAGLDGGQIQEGVGPGGRTRLFRGEKGFWLNLDISEIEGVKMAIAYRSAPDVHGVVVAGTGKPVSPTRPGFVTVIGRGIEVAQARCSVDADRAGKTVDAGFGFYRFTRSYGHCQQGNMPPTPGGEWAVASFEVSSMYSNDSHRRAPPSQQYSGFSIRLNSHGEVSKDPFLELGYVVVWRGKDTQPPTAPSGLKIARQGDVIRMRWEPAVDNLMVAYYELLRREGEGWTPVTVCTMTSLELPAGGLAAGSYAVRAVDVDEQRSAPCAAVQRP